MSTLAYSYSEPYKLPAGVLALVVHGAFFALLYFGVNWHAEPQQGMAVDIWESLPVPQVEPVKVEPVPPVEPPKLVEPPKPVEPPRPVTPPKPDIVLPEKKKPKAPEPAKPVEIKPVKPKKIESVQVDQKAQAAQVEQDRVHAAQAAQQAAAAAAIVSEVGKYTGLISSKIKRNIVRPPDVPDDALAEFDVILLPGGSVLSARLVKPSGSAAYDEAVERAILKAQPLPLPQDVSLFKHFRELHLIFKAKE